MFFFFFNFCNTYLVYFGVNVTRDRVTHRRIRYYCNSSRSNVRFLTIGRAITIIASTDSLLLTRAGIFLTGRTNERCHIHSPACLSQYAFEGNKFSIHKMRIPQKSLLALCLFVSVMATPTNDVALQKINQSTNSFSFNFIKSVAKEQQGNLISSPLSANIALSMAANGAAGATETQFKEVLKLPSKTETLMGFNVLIALLRNADNVTLKLANKMFIGKDFPVKSQYKQDLQTYYNSDIESIDFNQNAKAANIINTWSKENTNNLIKSIVEPSDLDPSLALILANAVYFKGNWAHQFDSKLTTDRPFYVDANTIKQVPTMYKQDEYKYVELPEHEAKCIELPYANKEISMVIILPDKIDGLAALVNNLEAVSADCNTRLAQTFKREVQLYLPKFKSESKLDLKNILSTKMGLSEPFSNTANFSGISDIPLKIDKVVQKAFIEVNEEGSEAAAVTEIEMENYSLVINRTIKDFNVDHPFFYGIIMSKPEEETYLGMFTGFVTNVTSDN